MLVFSYFAEQKSTIQIRHSHRSNCTNVAKDKKMNCDGTVMCCYWHNSPTEQSNDKHERAKGKAQQRWSQHIVGNKSGWRCIMKRLVRSRDFPRRQCRAILAARVGARRRSPGPGRNKRYHRMQQFYFILRGLQRSWHLIFIHRCIQLRFKLCWKREIKSRFI